MKDKVNQLFRDKLILVTVVLGLVAIVAAAGTVSIRKGNEHLEESPYLEIRESDGVLVGEYDETQQQRRFRKRVKHKYRLRLTLQKRKNRRQKQKVQ